MKFEKFFVVLESTKLETSSMVWANKEGEKKFRGSGGYALSIISGAMPFTLALSTYPK